MGTNTEQQQDERRPLLSPRRTGNNPAVFYLLFSVIFLFQSRIALIQGVMSFTALIPGLADRYGPLLCIMLALCGVLLAEVWSGMVYVDARTWPLQLLWAAPVCHFLGGGPATLVPQVVSVVRHVSSPASESSYSHLLELAAYFGNISAITASSLLMRFHLKLPIIMGVMSIVSAQGLVLFVFIKYPNTFREKAKDFNTESAPRRQYMASAGQQLTLTSRLSLLINLFQTNRATSVTLTGYFLRMLAVSVSKLHLIYAAAKFNWNYAEAASILVIDNAVHLTVLMLLPTVDTFLARFIPDITSRIRCFAGFSALCTLLGCVGVAISPSPFTMALSVAVFASGTGYARSVLSFLPSTCKGLQHDDLTSTMSLLDTLASLLGSILWPVLYTLGVREGGPGAGLPFGVAAVLMSLVLASVGIPGTIRALPMASDQDSLKNKSD